MRAGSRGKFFRRRLRYWLDHSERQRLLWEEMEFRIASMVEELVAQGMSEQEARAAAHRKFGNMTQKSEEARTTWIARWMSDLAQDLRHSFRGMRRDAGFTAFTIVIAGLGIGASSTVFSLVNALLLRPLPFRDPGRLVFITNGDDWTVTQTEHYSDLRDLNRSFQDLAGFAGYGVGDRQLTGTGEPERLTSVPGDWELLPIAGCAARDRKRVHNRGVPGQVFRSAGHTLELQLLAMAVRFRPQRGGPETDFEQPAGHGGGCAAGIL